MRQLIIIIVLLFLSENLFSQEMLLDLQSIPVKKSASTKSKNTVKTYTPKTLPFYDDFSTGQSSPSSTTWQPSGVLVNQTNAINPLTIGVATFDAIGSDGKIYSHLTTVPLKADSLTSLPINTIKPIGADDSLYLSFRYQPKGLGEQPEVNDSLVVYFFSKIDKQWVKAWAASANFTTNSVTEVNHLENKKKIQNSSSIDSTFFCAMIPITESKFLSDSFQFKIINYASLASNLQYPSIRGNCDMWHVDLVYLNYDRSIENTVIEDAAFCKPLGSFLKNYEAIPWKHFNTTAKLNEIGEHLAFKVQFRSFYSYTQNITIDYTIKDLSSKIAPDSINGGASNFDPFQIVDVSSSYDYTLESNWEDSAKFLLKSYLTTEVDLPYLKTNDIISYTQRFYNYYAYDDCSAENGYGLYGEGSSGGMLAVKFHSYEIDSLKGILFYFNEIPDFTRTNFDLVIWSDNNGKPGTQLYKKLVTKPLSAYNLDTLYKIDSKLKLGGDFWVGTINETEDFLNIGFDRNNDHSSKIYYNLTGEWRQTAFKGSLMIKPVFGKFTSWQTDIDIPIIKSNFTIYPNPASQSIRLNIPEGVKPEWIRIVNLTGQIMLSKPFDGSDIQLGTMQSGIYLVQLKQNNSVSTQKLLILR